VKTVGEKHYSFAVLPPGKELVSNVEEAGWVSGVGLESMESLALHRIISLDCPANSNSLY
jgi:hypothetical protein